MNSQSTFAIGIDVGGTTVKGGVIERSGAIGKRIKVDARGKEGPAVVIGVIRSVIEELLSSRNRAECAGVGIGCPGIVSEDGDSVSHPPNLHGWEDVKLATELKKHISLPVVIENDANAAAIAEATFGAGRNHKDFLFVIWGTGVGGGIVYNHKIFHGPHGGAGEIGHTSIDHNGPLCNCGSRGCIESYIGQRYLSERMRNRINGQPDSIVRKLVNGDLSKIEPSIISAAAEQGDSAAREILQEAGLFLGYSLASVFNILDIRVAVIGGGISAAPEFVFDAIRTGLTDRVLKTHRPHLKVVRATLGNAAGTIGAAAMMM